MSELLNINDGLELDSLKDMIEELIGSEPNETWKFYPLNNIYLISNHGRIVRGPCTCRYYLKGTPVCIHRNMKLLSPANDSDGYPVVEIRMDNEYKSMHVHRLVATTYIDNPDNKPTVNHKDGNKKNNNVDNLEWATWGENNRHAISTGLRVSVVPIKCLETGQVYESIAEAARDTGLIGENIRVSIAKQFTTNSGLTFIKLDGSVENESEYQKKAYDEYLWRTDNRHNCPILCLDQDIEFESWIAAARWLSVDSGAIQYAVDAMTCCRGHVFAKKDQVILDKQRYMDLCYTNSKMFKHLASKPTYSLYDKAIVLNSGGMDSTTCLSLAIAELGSENVCTVSAFYNQRHALELTKAKEISEYYGVNHFELDLSFLYSYSDCSLLSGSSQEIADKSYSDQIAETGGKISTYVPFRNGILLSSVAVLAQSLYPNEYTGIYIGAHADDSAGDAYPDCSPKFMSALAKSIAIGTYNKVGIVSPFVHFSKAQVCKTGLELHTPFQLTTSCYHGGDKACSKCGTCRDRIFAFKANGVIDPIQYSVPIDWSGCKKIDYISDKYEEV